jgi:Rieske Fe-S protein
LVALAGGGAAVLAACATDTRATDTPASTASGSSPPASSAPASSSPPGSGPSVAKSKVPVGGGAILEDADYVVTQPSEGTYKAFSKICTHQGCPVSEIADGAIKCNCHGSEFSIKDGSVIKPPATAPLKESSVTESGDNLVVSA